jgi:cytochrome P450
VHDIGLLATFVLIAALVFYFGYPQLTYFISFHSFARQHGIMPAKADRHWDPFFGLDFFIQTLRASRGNFLLEDLRARFSRIGPTFTSNVLGDLLIFTDEPKNARAVLVTNFDDFDLGELRRETTVRLLGHGIFNADGVHWARHRALIRPSFAKKQIADLSMMKRHVQHMISCIPEDGAPVDIQSCFFRMVGPPFDNQLKDKKSC